MRRTVSAERAATLLQSDAAAFVVVRDWPKLKNVLGAATNSVHELASWPNTEEPLVRIVGNYPHLEWTRHMAAVWGTLQVQTDGARLVRATETEVVLRSDEAHGAVSITNESEKPCRVRARIEGNGWEAAGERLLAKGETLRVSHD